MYIVVIIGEIFSHDPQVMMALLNPRLSLEHMLTNILLWRAAYKVNFSSILLSNAEGFHLIAKKNKNPFFLGQGKLFLCAVLTSSNYNIVKRILELDWTVNMFLTFLFSWEITDHQIMVICKICPVDFFFSMSRGPGFMYILLLEAVSLGEKSISVML